MQVQVHRHQLKGIIYNEENSQVLFEDGEFSFKEKKTFCIDEDHQGYIDSNTPTLAQTESNRLLLRHYLQRLQLLSLLPSSGMIN